MNELQTLRNIGPMEASLLTDIGVTTVAEFYALGAGKIYLQLQATGHQVTEDLLHKLRGAEKDIDWRILAERDQRRASSRFVDVDEP